MPRWGRNNFICRAEKLVMKVIHAFSKEFGRHKPNERLSGEAFRDFGSRVVVPDPTVLLSGR
jgi:hypothetical protein